MNLGSKTCDSTFRSAQQDPLYSIEPDAFSGSQNEKSLVPFYRERKGEEIICCFIG